MTFETARLKTILNGLLYQLGVKIHFHSSCSDSFQNIVYVFVQFLYYHWDIFNLVNSVHGGILIRLELFKRIFFFNNEGGLRFLLGFSLFSKCFWLRWIHLAYLKRLLNGFQWSIIKLYHLWHEICPSLNGSGFDIVPC